MDDTLAVIPGYKGSPCTIYYMLDEHRCKQAFAFLCNLTVQFYRGKRPGIFMRVDTPRPHKF